MDVAVVAVVFGHGCVCCGCVCGCCVGVDVGVWVGGREGWLGLGWVGRGVVWLGVCGWVCVVGCCVGELKPEEELHTRAPKENDKKKNLRKRKKIKGCFCIFGK